MPHSTLPTRHVYSPGRNQPLVDGDVIRSAAVQAATAGTALHLACPYPFWSEAGTHFTHIYRKTCTELKGHQ